MGETQTIPLKQYLGSGVDKTNDRQGKELINYLESRVCDLDGELKKRERKDRELNEARNYVKVMEKDILDIRKKYEGLTEELRNANRGKQEQNTLMIKLENELLMIRKENSTQTAQTVSIIERKKDKVKIMKDRIDEQSTENERLRSDKERLKEEGRKAIDEHKTVVDKNIGMSEELCLLRDKLATLRREFEDICRENEEIKPQLMDYERMASSYKEKFLSSSDRVKCLEAALSENEDEFKMVSCFGLNLQDLQIIEKLQKENKKLVRKIDNDKDIIRTFEMDIKNHEYKNKEVSCCCFVMVLGKYGNREKGGGVFV